MSQGFLLLAILTVSPSIQVSPAAILGKLVDSWNLYKEECLRNTSRDPLSTGLVCNRTFDNYVCWPDGQPNTTVSVSCPWYLPWHHKVQHGMEYQQCDANGQWLPKRNSSECESTDEPSLFYGQFLSPFRIIYSVGYSLSLVALVLALGILICFRKLHCMRNNIHMNLFASFILRAMSILIKDALLEAPNLKILTHDDISSDQLGFPRAPVYPVEVAVSNETMVACRIALVMMQYSIMANSYWLLVEGIYLHNLLVITVFTERNYFNIYLCIGWGTPLIVLVPWVIVKYMYENQECWVQNINMHYWWIIRSPILLAVVVNFLIFVHIIKILVSKLRAHQMRYTDYKFRLAKSTLTLIPLLGIHQVVFIFVTDESTQTTFALRLTRVFVDLFFTSFQGLLVAILYCFVNKEVQSEVLKKWKRWKLGRNIEEEYRHTYSHPPGGKSGSLLHNAPGLPRHPASATCGDLLCNHPEEKHTLMASCRNCRKGAVSSCTLVEDISLTDKAQCYEAPPRENTNRESHL